MSVARHTEAAGGFRAPAVRSWGVLTWGAAAAILLSTTAAIAQFIDYGVFNLRIQVLDADTHASIFGAISLLALLAAIFAAVVDAGIAADRRSHRVVLAVLMVGVLVFRLIHPTHVVLISAPLIALVFALLWSGDYGSARARRIVRSGCLLLAASLVVRTVGTEAVTALGYKEASWVYQAKVVAKHDLELAGWVLVATALAAPIFELRRRTRDLRRTVHWSPENAPDGSP
jgi:hypothetical protein